MSCSFISKALMYGNCKQSITQFICHQHVYPLVELAIPAFILPSRRASHPFGRYSFPIPLRVGG